MAQEERKSSQNQAKGCLPLTWEKLVQVYKEEADVFKVSRGKDGKITVDRASGSSAPVTMEYLSPAQVLQMRKNGRLEFDSVSLDRFGPDLTFLVSMLMMTFVASKGLYGHKETERFIRALRLQALILNTTGKEEIEEEIINFNQTQVVVPLLCGGGC